ncbi:hypothetical protein IMSAG013_01298 [Clostridiales bacterium]|nr:hypothetical protein IMSAG013_01298 [Clostridiales bacterium]
MNTETVLCIILEQRVCPCGTSAAFVVYSVRGCRCASAPDRRTSGCVGNDHSFTEQLGDQTCICRLCTACTCAGELKQRLFELAAFDSAFCKRQILFGYILYCIIEYFLLIQLGILQHHFQRSLFRLSRTGLHTKRTTHTIQRADCNGELQVFAALADHLCSVSCLCGSLSSFLSVQCEGTDGSMRTYKATLVTLNTVFFMPNGNHNGNAAFLVSGRALGEGTVCSFCERRYRQGITVHFAYRSYYLVNEFHKFRTVALSRSFSRSFTCVLPGCGNINLYKCAGTHIDCLMVLVNNVLTELGIGLGCHILHVSYSFIQGHDLCQCKECSLQNCILNLCIADIVLCNGGCIDDIELNVIVRNVGLHRCGQVCVQLVSRPQAVQKESAAGLYIIYNLEALQNVGRIVAGNKVCLGDVVRTLNRSVAKTQVGNGNAAGFLGVILEVCLNVFIGVVADDLDGVLVCTNGTVAAQTPELAGDSSLRRGVRSRLFVQRQTGYVIYDTDCEVCLGCVACKVFIYSKDGSGSGILGTETVTSAYNSLIGNTLGCKCGHNIQIQRLAQCTGFLCSVQNSDLLSCFRNCSNKLVRYKRSVQTYFYKTNLLACSSEVVDYFFCHVADRAHSDDYTLCVRCAVVVECLVISTQLLVYFIKVFIHDSRQFVIITVACFTMLEEDVAVFSRTAEHRMFRIERTAAERVDCVHIYHFLQIFVIPCFDLLDLMRGAETVKEVQERNAAFNGCQMCNGTEVHNFLGVGFSEHCITGLTACINIGMVAENVQRVGSNAACRNMNYAGKQLTCDFVHVRDHQQKALRCCICSRQRTCCQGAVYSACSACLRLHFHYADAIAENVACAFAENVLVRCRPGVCDFRHRRGRSDGIDCGNFRERIGYMRRGGVTVHGYFSSCHVGVPPVYLVNSETI